VAAPGATGVAFDSARPYGVGTVRPTEMPSPLPSSAVPEPLPDDPPPSPFVEPPSPSKKKDGKGSGDGSKVGPLPKGVQL
jgi:hypothetical protein